MKKLTAEKCREMLMHFKSLNIQGHLLEEGKQILQALEIALPVLEHQESTTDTYRQIENDGWIEWVGGERPVDRDCAVVIRYRDGEKDTGIAGYQSWRHYAADDDIIAYRVIENDGREG